MQRRMSNALRRVLALGAAVVVAAGLAVAGGGAVAAAGGGVVSVAAAVPAAPSCATWSKKAEQKRFPKLTNASITGVRAGKHTCFDRIVIDLGPGKAPGYRVKYVTAVTDQGRGRVIPLKGSAKLEVIVTAAAYRHTTMKPTYQPDKPKNIVNAKKLARVKQVAFGGSFEGQTTFGIGVDKKRPFTVFVLKGPGNGQRLVIDIARR